MGPLAGLRIVELGGIGPVPFAGMLFSTMGAEVVRIDPPPRVRAAASPMDNPVLGRGRRSLAINLRQPDGADVILRVVARADALIEGFRPGVAEGLGVGPEACKARNERLVFGRMTGWGQDGPLAMAAGHDINFIALPGALEHLGRAGSKPTPPINLLGDFGGGGMFLAFGVLCALHEAASSGQGQIVDAAIVDGVAALMSSVWGMRARGSWSGERGTNLLDTGAPFYDVYETSDGRFVAIGPVEPAFYDELLARVGVASDDVPPRGDRSQWTALRERLDAVFRSRSRDEWCSILEGTDACFAPVLSMDEAAEHPHVKERATIITADGIQQPAPAPRFSRTPGATSGPPVAVGHDTRRLLLECGFDRTELTRLERDNVIYQAPSGESEPHA